MPGNGEVQSAAPRAAAESNRLKLCSGMHKHVPQPYYDAVNPEYWDGERYLSNPGPTRRHS